MSNFRLYLGNLKSQLQSRLISDQEDRLWYVHVGKTGGISVGKAVRAEVNRGNQFNHFGWVHGRRPPLHKRSRYLISVRDPIERAQSAFHYRYRHVVLNEGAPEFFRGERAVLIKYGSLNCLAEKLYDGEKLNRRVARDFKKIHHLRENHSFYLDRLLLTVRPEQIFGVLSTENLGRDFEHLFGEPLLFWDNAAPKTTRNQATQLSPVSIANLRQFLAPDYEVLRDLAAVAGHEKQSFDSLY